MPFAAIGFIIGGLVSMGMPGFSGFVAEFPIFMGVWRQQWLVAVIASISIVITAAYIMRNIRQVFFSELPAKFEGHLTDVTVLDKVAITTLCLLMVLIGLFPRLDRSNGGNRRPKYPAPAGRCMMFTSTLFTSILPEILILILGLLILVVEPFWREEQRRNVGWLTAAGLLPRWRSVWPFGRPGEPIATLGGMVRFDWLGFFFKMLFMFAGAATTLLLMDNEKVGHRGEAYLLLLASLLGMNLMAASADLVMLYLAIETTSIPLYVLAGFMLADERSTEAGFKFLLFGALTSTVMLYGFSLIFGFTGTTDIYQLAGLLSTGDLPSSLVSASWLLCWSGSDSRSRSYLFIFGRRMSMKGPQPLWLGFCRRLRRLQVLLSSSASLSLPSPILPPPGPRSGGSCGRHNDCRQPACSDADQYQAAAGFFFGSPRRLRVDRCRGWNPARRRKCDILSRGLYSDQFAGLRNCHGLQPRARASKTSRNMPA